MACTSWMMMQFELTLHTSTIARGRG